MIGATMCCLGVIEAVWAQHTAPIAMILLDSQATVNQIIGSTLNLEWIT